MKNCPTKNQILDAAKESKEIAAALKKLFPSAFDGSMEDLIGNYHETRSHQVLKPDFVEMMGGELMQIRTGGSYIHKGFWLNSDFDWEIVTENTYSKTKVLIPTRKNQ